MRIDLPVKPSLPPYCRQLVAEGVDPATVLHVYRGDTLCFVPAPLAVFAALATEERAAWSIRFVRYREITRQGDGYAPLTGAKHSPATPTAKKGGKANV